MSAIQATSSTKNYKRTTTAFDQRLAFSQGFSYLITPTSTPVSVADVISNAGVIVLPNVYPMGRNALRVYIDGALKPQAGVDFTEDSPSQITLDPALVATLNASTSNIWFEWNRFLPGARDQELADLTNVSPDIEDAVLDPNTLRSVATGLNPFATLTDISGIAGQILDAKAHAFSFVFSDTDLGAAITVATWPVGTKWVRISGALTHFTGGTVGAGRGGWLLDVSGGGATFDLVGSTQFSDGSGGNVLFSVTSLTAQASFVGSGRLTGAGAAAVRTLVLSTVAIAANNRSTYYLRTVDPTTSTLVIGHSGDPSGAGSACVLVEFIG